MYRVEIIYDYRTEFIMAEHISIEKGSNYLDERVYLQAKTISGETHNVNSQEKELKYIYVNGKLIFEKRKTKQEQPVYTNLDHVKEYFSEK